MADHNGYVGVGIDLKTPLVMLTSRLQACRKELVELLTDGGERCFDDHHRLLDEYQSLMRAIDVLSGTIDTGGNVLKNATNGVGAKVVGETARLVEGGKVITETIMDRGEQIAKDAENAIKQALTGHNGHEQA
jgi:hypothetical protein